MALSFAVLIAILFSSDLYAQESIRAHLLGTWVGGEDPSEFLLHKVIEQSVKYFEENPDGILVVRICSADVFRRAFVKTPLNPLTVVAFDRFRPGIPSGRVFVTSSAVCVNEKDSVPKSEYWFVPKGIELEYDEIVPICQIDSKSFANTPSDEPGKRTDKQQFERNIRGFVAELRNNQAVKGMIVFRASNRAMKRNITSLRSQLNKERLDDRIEAIEIPRAISMDYKNKVKYPNLVTFSIRSAQC